jgi:hypothetical protein
VCFPTDEKDQYEILQKQPKCRFCVTMKEPELKVILHQRLVAGGAKVFNRTMAAGQMLAGVDHQVAAMGSAQKAVLFLDRYPRGQSLKLPRILETEKILPARVEARRASELCRQVAKGLLAASYVPRGDDRLNEEDASLAAVPCLRCAKPMDYYDKCWYCLPCEVECPTNALIPEIPFLVK